VYEEYLRHQLAPYVGHGSEARTVYGLGEDITSGSGAANAIIATVWSHDVVDLIRAKTFLFKAGATTIPLPSELYNLPLFAADVAPTMLPNRLAFPLTLPLVLALSSLTVPAVG